MRHIKFIQRMNRKFDKSNKCDPTLNQGAFIFQTDGRRYEEVPREAHRERQRGREMANKQRGGGVKQDPHTKPGIILVAPLSCGRLG